MGLDVGSVAVVGLSCWLRKPRRDLRSELVADVDDVASAMRAASRDSLEVLIAML